MAEDIIVKETSELREGEATPEKLIVIYDPNHVPDENDPEHIPSYKVDLGSLNVGLLPWDMEGPLAPPTAVLWDYMSMSVMPSIVGPDTYENNGSSLALAKLGNVQIPANGKYFFTAKLWDTASYYNGVILAIGDIGNSCIVRINDNGLVFIAQALSAPTETVVDANYQAGDIFLLCLNTQTGVLDIITENTVSTGHSVGLVDTVGVILYDAMSSAVNNGRVYLTSKESDVEGIITIPGSYADYEYYGAPGPALIPENAKEGSVLKAINSGMFGGRSYNENDAAILLSIDDQKVFKLEEILSTGVTVKVPTDFPDITSVYNHFKSKPISSSGYVLCLLEDDYVITSPVMFSGNWNWLHIQPENKFSTIGLTQNSLYMFYLQGQPGTILGTYEYTEPPIASYKGFVIIAADTYSNVEAVTTAYTRSCGYLRLNGHPGGGFSLDYSLAPNATAVPIVVDRGSFNISENNDPGSSNVFYGYTPNIYGASSGITTNTSVQLENCTTEVIVFGPEAISDPSEIPLVHVSNNRKDTEVTVFASGYWSLQTYLNANKNMGANIFPVSESQYENIPDYQTSDTVYPAIHYGPFRFGNRALSVTGNVNCSLYVGSQVSFYIPPSTPFAFEFSGIGNHTLENNAEDVSLLGSNPTEAVIGLRQGARLFGIRFAAIHSPPGGVTGCKKMLQDGTYSTLVRWVADTDTTLFMHNNY